MRWYLLVLAGIFFCAPAFAEPAGCEGTSLAAVAEEAILAVVRIEATGQSQKPISPFASNPFFEAFFQFGPYERRSSGSGVIVSANGLIATCAHVIEGAAKIQVTLSNEATFNAEVVLTEPLFDIAILRLINPPQNLPHLPVAKAPPAVGDTVIAIGNAFSVGQTTTHGIISAVNRVFDSQVLGQTDAPINPGNSGGPIIACSGKLKGQIVGLASAIASQTGASHGVGFFVPSAAILGILQRVAKKSGRTQLPLRVQTAKPAILQALKERGYPVAGCCVVEEVLDKDIAGHLRPGDFILSVAGIRTTTEALFHFLTRVVPAGEDYNISILRADALQKENARPLETVRVRAKEEKPEAKSSIGPSATARWSVESREEALKALQEAELEDLPQGGVLVRSIGENHYIRPKDIIITFNGQYRPTAASIQQAAATKSTGLSITLFRGRQTISVSIH